MTLHSIPHQSFEMETLLGRAQKGARYSTPIMLCGETGTGKGHLARAVHAVGPRRHEPFVHVDCAGLVDGLLEAELYGVARGGFTGASHDRPGRFESAGRGTLFLDEVGELSTSGQRKLLRALEEGCFERVGETRTRQIQARVIAATHVDLARAVREGRFRADLFYRLRVLCLDIPPLRNRVEDLDAWIRIARKRAAERLGHGVPDLSRPAKLRLREHAWPGNLRELFHAIEAMGILVAEPDCDASFDSSRDANSGVEGDAEAKVGFSEIAPHLSPPTLQSCSSLGREGMRGENEGGRVRRGRVDSAFPPSSPSPSAGGDAHEALADSGGNLSLAARRLGVPRSTLRYRLGLDDPVKRAGLPKGTN